MIGRCLSKNSNKTLTVSGLRNLNGFWKQCILMFVLVLIVFGNYLTGQRSYVFLDIATDSGGQTYPGLVDLARDISNGNMMNRWNFVSSLGNSSGVVLPKLSNLEAFFGTENVRYLMGFNMAAKVFFAGVFFYLYLKALDISDSTSSIFSIFYAFCANNIIRGSWRSYPNEVLVLAIWLYAFEVWKKDKTKWMGFVLATVFFYFNSSNYQAILYTGIFIVYAVFREFVSKEGIHAKELFWDIGKAVLTIIGVLVIMLPIWGAGMAKTLESDRLANGLTKASNYELSSGLTSFQVIKTAFYRTIGMDLLGINDYYGTDNFLEAPAFYCGILTLLLIPSILYVVKRRKRIWYGIGIIGMITYIFIRPVRFLVNGFSGHSFKLASLWVMVLMLYIVSNEFDTFLEDTQKPKVKTIYITAIVLGILSAVLYIEGMSIPKLLMVLGFMAVYVVVFVFWGKGVLSAISVKKIFLMLVLVEVVSLSYDIVNDRVTMDGQDVYKDGTMEALEMVRDENADQDFYRIDKLYSSVTNCDSLYQNYMGTVGYIGGTGDRKSTGNFYNALSMPILGGNNHGMCGFSSSTKINTLVNVKYILSKSGMQTNFGYQKIGMFDNISIYENQYALPLGYVYDTYITMEDFMKLNVEARRAALMSSCVLEADNAVCSKKEAYLVHDLDLSEYEIAADAEITESWVRVQLPELKEGCVNVVELEVESKASKSSMLEYYDGQDRAVTTYIGVLEGNDKYYLEFNDTNIHSFQLFGIDQYTLHNMKFYQVPQDKYYGQYIEDCMALMENGLQIEKFDCNIISGTIESAIDGMMTLSIPYDSNWHIYIDGEEQELQTVNIGMMGTAITKGHHTVEFVYRVSSRAMVYSAAGVFVLVVLGIYILMKKKI